MRADGFSNTSAAPRPSSTGADLGHGAGGQVQHLSSSSHDRSSTSRKWRVTVPPASQPPASPCRQYHDAAGATPASSSTAPSTASASSISSSAHEQRRSQADGVGARRVHHQAPARAAAAVSLAASASQRGAEQQPAPAHADHAVEHLEPGPQPGPGRSGPGRHVLGLHDRQRGPGRRRRQGLPAEGAAVIAGREGRRHLGARPARPDGHAVAESLGHGDDVGLDARVLEREPPSGAARARSGSRPR